MFSHIIIYLINHLEVFYKALLIKLLLGPEADLADYLAGGHINASQKNSTKKSLIRVKKLPQKDNVFCEKKRSKKQLNVRKNSLSDYRLSQLAEHHNEIITKKNINKVYLEKTQLNTLFSGLYSLKNNPKALSTFT